ncbi:hypothetical protein [Terriglobus sp.]|uniref:hypothetical protein n=1 Tax=Terriglobus sp. TaxID=1889013 RepID=UPI003B002C3E
MQIQLTAEQEVLLSEVATHEGKPVGELLMEYATLALQKRSRFLAEVDEGLASAERGDFLEEEAMDARVRAMLER